MTIMACATSIHPQVAAGGERRGNMTVARSRVLWDALGSPLATGLLRASSSGAALPISVKLFPSFVDEYAEVRASEGQRPGGRGGGKGSATFKAIASCHCGPALASKRMSHAAVFVSYDAMAVGMLPSRPLELFTCVRGCLLPLQPLEQRPSL